MTQNWTKKITRKNEDDYKFFQKNIQKILSLVKYVEKKKS
jgi:hypothetical protein